LLFHREDGSSPFDYSSHTHITYLNISPTPVIDPVRNSFDVLNIVEKHFTEPYFTAVSHQLTEAQHWELIVLQLVNRFPAFYGAKLFITIFTKTSHCPYPETYIQSSSSSSYCCKIHTNIVLQSILNSSPLSFLSSLSA
jgi:hypothetical protein